MNRMIDCRSPLIALLLGMLLAGPAWGQQDTEKKSSRAAITRYSDAANFHNNGAYDVALEEWSKFLEKHPTDPLAPKARHYQAVCYMQLKQYPKAAAAFQEVIQKHPKFEFLADAILNLGWCRFVQAKQQQDPVAFESAAKAFGELVAKTPNSKHVAQALYFQGEALYLAGKTEASIKPYSTLLQQFPDSDLACDAAYAVGVAYEELKQWGQAQRYYDRFLGDCKEHKLTSEVRMRKAESVLQGGDPKTAAKLFAQVSTIPDFASADHALFRQAFCFAEMEDFKTAGDLYAALVERFPESSYTADAAISAGRAYYRAKADAESLKWLLKVVEKGEAAAIEAAHWACRLHLRNNRPADALQLAERMLSNAGSDPYVANLMMDKADALFATRGRESESQPIYVFIADKYPKHAVAPQALYNAAYGMMREGQYDDAVAAVERFLKSYGMDPLAPDARYVRAESYMGQRKFAEAAAELRELTAGGVTHPDKPYWQVRLGAALYGQKQFGPAEAHLAGVIPTLKDANHRAEALFYIGASQFAQDKFADAVATLQQCEDANPKWTRADEALLYRARSLRKVDQIPAARALVERILKQFPNSALRDEAHYRLGELHYAVGEFPAAIKQYDRVPVVNPKSAFVPFALYGAGWSHLKSNAYDPASRAFSRLLEDYPQHELANDALFARAMSRRQEKNYKGVLEDVTAFLASQPNGENVAHALYERGLAEVGLQRLDAAAKTFQSILQSHPDYANGDKVLYELAWAHKAGDDNTQAVARFAELGQKYPNSDLAAEAFFHVGEQRFSDEQFKEAIRFYSKSVEAAQRDVMHEKAIYKLGWARFKAEDFRAAQDAFRQQAERHPEGVLIADAAFMQGECAFKLQEYKDAWEAYQNALKLNPTNKVNEVLTLLHAGQSANQLENWTAAEQTLTRLIDQHPESTFLPEAYFERGRARENLDRSAEAKEDYTEATDNSRGEVGARAGFMLGELLFAEKKYEEAVRRFQRVMFGFGADKAEEPVRNWQAKSGFEAGRCSEVLITQTEGQAKSKAIADARKFYDYVVRSHPRHELAPAAKKRLEVLLKL